MAQKSRLTSILSGIAGEYFVAAELSRRGYVASLTLRNTRGIDILASNAEATESVGIQVKTNQGGKRRWLLSEKAERDLAENLFYIFVNLNESGPPEYHIVPRAVVAKYVRDEHAAWPGLQLADARLGFGEGSLGGVALPRHCRQVADLLAAIDIETDHSVVAQAQQQAHRLKQQSALLVQRQPHVAALAASITDQL